MKPQLSLKSRITCMNQKHKNEQVKILCLNKDCKQSPLLCSICLTEFLHETCKFNLISLKQLKKKDLFKMQNWPTDRDDYEIKIRLDKYENLVQLDRLIEKVSDDLRGKVNKAIDEIRINTKNRYRLLIQKRDFDIDPLRELYVAAYGVEAPLKIIEELETWKKNIYQAIESLEEFRKNDERSLAIKDLKLLSKEGKFPAIPDESVADRAFKVILWQLQNLPLEFFGQKRVTSTIEYTLKKIEDEDGIYVGQVVDSKKHGVGKYSYKNGNVYEGEMSKGVMQGKGKYTWKNGNIYEGTFVNDKMNGYGKLTFGNGDIYEGEFVNNKACGDGRMVNKNGEAYEGGFFNNLRQGKGKEFMKNGNVFEGEFFEGKWHGRGKITFPDTTIQEGVWLENVKQ